MARARPDDDADLTPRRGLPGIVAFALRERRVQHRDAVAEDRFKAPRRLRRERDFRNEHDRASAGFDDVGDRFQIDERLAAAGDTVEQQLIEGRRRQLLANLRERRALIARRRERGTYDAFRAAQGACRLLDLANRAGCDRARDDGVRVAFQQRIGAPQRTRFANGRSERSGFSTGDRAVTRNQQRRHSLGHARAAHRANARKIAAAYEVPKMPQQGRTIGSTSRFRMAQECFYGKAIAQIVPNQSQQTFRHAGIS